MSTTWLIRAGEDAKLANAFESAKKVGVGWSDLEGVEDLRFVERAEVASALRSAGKSASVASLDADELIAFRDTLALGDLVVTPDPVSRQVLVGEIASDYDFNETATVGTCHHVREVLWLGRIDRDLLTAELRTDTNFRRTLKPSAREADWVALAERLRNGERLAGPRKSTAPRGRLEAIEAERAASERKCGACGYMKRSTQFDESGVCVDCR